MVSRREISSWYRTCRKSRWPRSPAWAWASLAPRAPGPVIRPGWPLLRMRYAQPARGARADAPKVLAKHPMPAVRSLAASPIIVDGRLWGVVNASTRRRTVSSAITDRLGGLNILGRTTIPLTLSNVELRTPITRTDHNRDR